MLALSRNRISTAWPTGETSTHVWLKFGFRCNAATEGKACPFKCLTNAAHNQHEGGVQ